jgi:hypothetical protein
MSTEKRRTPVGWAMRLHTHSDARHCNRAEDDMSKVALDTLPDPGTVEAFNGHGLLCCDK